MEQVQLSNGRTVILKQAESQDYEALNIYLEQLGQETIFTLQYPGRPAGSREKFEYSVVF